MIAMPALGGDAREPQEPGDGPTPAAARESRRLAEPPSARYAPAAENATGRSDSQASGGGGALAGPVIRAVLVAAVGSLLLTIVGSILASTGGLLFVAGVMGAALGLVLSRAAVPSGVAAPVPRRTVAWIAIGLSVAAIAVSAFATWVYARGEGGTLGLLDYLLATFGPFVPAEAVIASVTAWWGASIGPVQS